MKTLFKSFCKSIFATVFVFLYLLPQYEVRCQPAETDSVKVAHLLDSAFELESNNRQEALRLYQHIIQFSESSGYDLGKAKALHYSAIVYSDMNMFEESLKHYHEAIRLYTSINNKRGIGACYGNIGNLFLYQGMLDSAVVYYQKGINIFEEYDVRNGLSVFYGNAGGIFQRLKQYDNARSYFERSLNLAIQEGDSVMICRALTNKGALLFDLKQYDESIKVHMESLALAEKLDDTYSLSNNCINLANCYRLKGSFGQAIDFGLKALEYANKIGTPFDIADVKKSLGDLYSAAGKFKQAEDYYMQALALADEFQILEIKAAAYNSLHELHARSHNYKDAYKFQGLAKQYQDSILSEKQLKTINELEVRYQSLRKDKEIAQNNLQLEQSRRYFAYSVGVALVAILSAWLILVYYRNKRNMYARQLDSMQKEKEVQVLQALMEGEEKERSRIASDLHDEVSGMLTAAKMHLTSISKSSPSLVQGEGYQKVVTLLDEASVHVRNTAHNLLPEILIQNGLKEAIERYCHNISYHESLIVKFYCIGGVARYSHNFELAVYRIVQELVNNVIKHANATSAFVQLADDKNILSITVEDNGIGFPEGQQSNGLGLMSLSSRIKSLNGTLDISSRTGEGVSVTIEFQTEMHRP